MIKINYNKVILKTQDDVFVYPIGDLHIGHINCDLNFIQSYLNTIKQTDEESNRVLLMGDLLDCGLKDSIGGSVYENILTPQEQIEVIVNILKPIANRIDGYVQGNHEYRIYKNTGIDVCKNVCSILNIPYLKYSGVVTYSFAKESKKKAYNINMFHGKAGGGVENALRKCKEMANKVNSDIYLMGHCHHKAYTTRCFKQIDSRNGKIVDTLQYFILTGHALNYDDSYADQANLEISHKDFPIIKLSNNGRKSITVY